MLPSTPDSRRGSKNKNIGKKSNHYGLGFLFTQSFLSHVLVGLCCFYMGTMIGMSSVSSSRRSTEVDYASEFTQARGLWEASDEQSLTSLRSSPETFVPPSPKESQPASSSYLLHSPRRTAPFPKSTQKFVIDFATVPREAFSHKLDVGVPLDDTIKGAEDVLILYTNLASMPNGLGTHQAKVGLDTERALENCHTVKVILQEPGQPAKNKSNQCIAIVPQWESYYVHKFMRLPKAENVDVDLTYPLRYVSRLHSDKGEFGKVPKLKAHTMPNYELLVQYLKNLKPILRDLQPFLKRVMDQYHNPTSNTLVVLTCNKGQSVLFQNFVCNSRAKGMDLGNVVMFATDEYTLQLSQELGIAAWYDPIIFGNMPEDAARKYGDRTFAKMMLAKVYCVHLVLQSGYNVLYQDVDVVWFRNPLSFFDSLKETKELEEWDMMFQDDGSRHRRYGPYSPNTGTPVVFLL
jgi:Nucleotide-diphospho-sugar transferase